MAAAFPSVDAICTASGLKGWGVGFEQIVMTITNIDIIIYDYLDDHHCSVSQYYKVCEIYLCGTNRN